MPHDCNIIQLNAAETAALQTLLEREMIDTCSNEKAAIYQAIRAKLGAVHMKTRPDGADPDEAFRVERDDADWDS